MIGFGIDLAGYTTGSTSLAAIEIEDCGCPEVCVALDIVHHKLRWPDPANADKCMRRFGGEKFDPRAWGKGNSWARWRK